MVIWICVPRSTLIVVLVFSDKHISVASRGGWGAIYRQQTIVTGTCVQVGLVRQFHLQTCVTLGGV